MASTSSGPLARRVAPATFYRKAWAWLLSALALSVLAFWPSYFSRLGDAPAVMHAHGLTALAWLSLLVGQAWLYQRRNLQWHRLLGAGSLLLAPAFVVSGLLMVRYMLAGDAPMQQRLGARLAFIDLTTVAWFAFVYLQALRYRHCLPLHARYMASTALLVLPPASSRAASMLPGVGTFETAAYLAYAVAFAATLALLSHDWRSTGRASGAYLSVLALFLLHVAGFNLLDRVPGWEALVRGLAS